MTPEKPPKEIPDELWNDYTLFGRIPVDYWSNFSFLLNSQIFFFRYFDRRPKSKPRKWKGIDQQFRSGANIFKYSTYGDSTREFKKR